MLKDVRPKATTAPGYAGLVWEKELTGQGPHLLWAPRCRKRLEPDGDYAPEAA
jgi:hypothetical protein